MEARRVDDVRVSPAVIAAAVPSATPERLLWRRTRFGLGILGISAILIWWAKTTIGANWPLLALPLIFLAAVKFSDGMELLQRDAEQSGLAFKRPDTLFARPQGNSRRVAISDLRVGDWVCPESEYLKHTRRIRERREYLESDYKRRLEEHAARERDEEARFNRELQEWNRQQSAGDGRHPGPAPQRRLFDPPYTPDLPELPEPDTFPILVLHTKGKEDAVDIWCMGRDVFTLHPDDFALRIDPDSRITAPKEATEYADAISDLLLLAPTTWSKESALTKTLRQRSHSDKNIEHAIRACIASGFLLHGRKTGRRRLDTLPRVRSLLRVSHTTKRERQIRLSPLGEAWARTHLYPMYPEAIPPSRDTMTYNFMIFNAPVSGSNIGGVGNTINNGQSVSLADLAAATVALLDAERHRFSEATDPKALIDALEELRSAINESQVPESRVKKALGVVVSVAGNLSMGVAGNFIFEAIKATLSN
ncbi:hypothetical protein [Microbispora catharanthi]|uniref:Uncharacterized protein n=1 Tax=Microbispora catharanthi TaxID=1712871 RepID=A0A5N6C051_9ACTN|nr:hypothetical protein [Microbispora catharanthi]KAB8185813.1 hypothetical protein FH610_008490 [Microbispora catharanthi]